MARIWAILRALVLVFALLGGMAAEALAGPYRDYALSLNGNLPAGAQFRPDLEAVLANLANAYRASEGRGALRADGMFLVAARAMPPT